MFIMFSFSPHVMSFHHASSLSSSSPSSSSLFSLSCKISSCHVKAMFAVGRGFADHLFANEGSCAHPKPPASFFRPSLFDIDHHLSSFHSLSFSFIMIHHVQHDHSSSSIFVEQSHDVSQFPSIFLFCNIFHFSTSFQRCS